MSNIAQLKQQLKAVKLSGTLATVELRLMEAAQNQLSLGEMLSMILSDELETRQNRRLQRLISNAKLEANQTLENFDFTFNPSINAAQIRQLATGRFIEKAENIFLVGPTGTGKSYIAKALGHSACRNYLTVGFYNFRELFTMLSQAELTNKSSKLLKNIIKYNLLIIDDFAFRKIDQKSAEYLYAITDARYGTGSVILTSNRSVMLSDKFNNNNKSAWLKHSRFFIEERNCIVDIVLSDEEDSAEIIVAPVDWKCSHTK